MGSHDNNKFEQNMELVVSLLSHIHGIGQMCPLDTVKFGQVLLFECQKNQI